MNVLDKTLDFIKGNWKNLSLFILVPFGVAMTVALIVVASKNTALKNELSDATAENQELTGKLNDSQTELDELKSQYTSLSTKVDSPDNYAYRDLEDDKEKSGADGTASTNGTSTNGTTTLKNSLTTSDGKTVTAKDVDNIKNENDSLKKENDDLNSEVNRLQDLLNSAQKTNSDNSSAKSLSDTLQAQNSALSSENSSLASENDNLRNQIASLNNTISALEADKSDLSNANNTLKNENSNLSKQLSNAVNENSNLSNKNLELALANETLNNNLSNANSNLSQATSDYNKNLEAITKAYNDSLAKATSDYNESISAAEKAYNDALANRTDDYNENMDEAEKAYNDSLAQATDAYNKSMAEAEKAYNDSLAQANADYGTLSGAYDNLSGAYDSLSGEYSNLNDKNKQLIADLDNVEAQLDSYKEQLVKDMTELSATKQQVNQLRAESNSLEDTLAQTQADLERIENAYNALTGSIDDMTYIEMYRDNVDNTQALITEVQAQIDAINKITEWSEYDQAQYDTLLEKIEFGLLTTEQKEAIEALAQEGDPEGVYNEAQQALFDEYMAQYQQEADQLLADHTLTDEEIALKAELENQLAQLNETLAAQKQELADAEAAWLAADPAEKLDTLLQADERLRDKIDSVNTELANKNAELETALGKVDAYEAEIYKLKECIGILESEYSSISIDAKLIGSYETIDGDIDFNLSGTENFNGLVSSVQTIITNLKNRVNTLLDVVAEVVNSIKEGLIVAGDDVEETVDENGHTLLKSKLIHKRVNIVLFGGTADQITIQGDMPYGQITKISSEADVTTYIDEETGAWTGETTTP